MAVLTTINPGLAGAGGLARIAAGSQLLFAEAGGFLGVTDLDTGVLVRIGSGWASPRAVAVDAAGTSAYVTEDGAVVRVALAAADRAQGVELTTGLTAARQLALDEAGGALYLVESADPGRLVKVELATGTATVVCGTLQTPVGLAVDADRAAAYVTEQPATGGRLTRVDLATGGTSLVVDGLTAPAFLGWAEPDRRSALLLVEGDPGRRLLRVDVSGGPAVLDVVATGLPAGPVHALPLGTGSYVLSCAAELALVVDDRPTLDTVSAGSGHGGTILEVLGRNFSALREDNKVDIGGRPARVFEASTTRLRVLTDPSTATGPVTVSTPTGSVATPDDFVVLPYPGADEDGPPVVAQGQGDGDPKVLPSTGSLRVLVSLVFPRDLVPADQAGARNAIVDKWNSVRTYYDQASFATLNVTPTVTAGWRQLSGNAGDYVDLGTLQNVTAAAKPRLVAEAAQAAQAQGLNLGDFDVIVPLIWLNGAFIRAWGGVFQQTFSFHGKDTTGNSVDIDITAPHELAVIWIGDNADWGRHAHELGHAIVSSPYSGVLGEDIYQSDLVDPGDASAQHFDLMGKHDEHPLFSAYHLEKLGWYSAIETRQWNRNPTTETFTVAAHGSSKSPPAGSKHLVKIVVAAGLSYYVEVRSRIGPAGQIYDPQIPQASDGSTRGVIVTKVVTGEVNNNQEMRFISLLHDERLLAKGDSAVDPARALTITVTDVQPGPGNTALCTVTVAWAQGVADDPNGAFDLSIEPWDGNYQTPDIWVDRDPFGSFDQSLDAQGRPRGTGDKPKVNAINHFIARIHVSGTVGATSVPVTFYSVTPPGVGDNGDWTPMKTVPAPSIPANSFADVQTNWTPTLNKHTCLKVFAGAQLGEVSGKNNSAQENVFDFEAASSSVPEAVTMPFAVRNPQPFRRAVMVSLAGVPLGYTAQIPHAWVWLDGHEARELELTVIPTEDFPFYLERRKRSAPVRISGYVERTYETEAAPGADVVGSRVLPIGGVLARVTPKKRGGIRLDDRVSPGEQGRVRVRGRIEPPWAGERVTVRAVDDNGTPFSERVTTTQDGEFTADVQTDDQWRRLRAVASIEASPTVAEADSPEVVFER